MRKVVHFGAPFLLDKTFELVIESLGEKLLLDGTYLMRASEYQIDVKPYVDTLQIPGKIDSLEASLPAELEIKRVCISRPRFLGPSVLISKYGVNTADLSKFMRLSQFLGGEHHEFHFLVDDASVYLSSNAKIFSHQFPDGASSSSKVANDIPGVIRNVREALDENIRFHVWSIAGGFDVAWEYACNFFQVDERSGSLSTALSELVWEVWSSYEWPGGLGGNEVGALRKRPEVYLEQLKLISEIPNVTLHA